MNPRHRRLLIPGLLVALVVVVVVASLTREARAAQDPSGATTVSRIDDPRVSESSGLAVSAVHEDLAYSVDDSGSEAVVDAVRVSTGEVVGQTVVEGAEWVDVEALALADGTLWVADVGDNEARRDDAALYALDEPGPGDGSAEATRYPVGYADGPQDVESFAVVPTDGRMLLVSKELLAGRVLELPRMLSEDDVNVARDTGTSTLLLATDASASPDGRSLLVRNYTTVEVLDAASGESVRTEALPQQPQGETVAFEPSGESFLVGSEGATSTLFRLGFEADVAGTPAPTATPQASARPVPPEPGVGRPWLTQAVGVLAVVALALVSAWMSRSGQRRRRRRRGRLRR